MWRDVRDGARGILFIEGAFPLAAHWYGIARRSADEVGDQYLADIALAGSIYLPTCRSDLRAVLANVSSRLDASHAPSPAIAWLWGFRAKAHAVLGEADAFQESIDRARQALDRSAPELVRPGIFSFVPEKLAFYEARGWIELNDDCCHESVRVRSSAGPVDLRIRWGLA